MAPETAIELCRNAMMTTLLVGAPLLIVGMVVGFAISLLQALTQIQDQTVSFVPKIVAMFVVLVLALPFMGDVLSEHMNRIAALIVAGG